MIVVSTVPGMPTKLSARLGVSKLTCVNNEVALRYSLGLQVNSTDYGCPTVDFLPHPTVKGLHTAPPANRLRRTMNVYQNFMSNETYHM